MMSDQPKFRRGDKVISLKTFTHVRAGAIYSVIIAYPGVLMIETDDGSYYYDDKFFIPADRKGLLYYG